MPKRSRSILNFESLSDCEGTRLLVSERNLLGWNNKDRSSGVVISQREKSIGRHQQMDATSGRNSGVARNMCKVLQFF
jgi:hypothetical protein